MLRVCCKREVSGEDPWPLGRILRCKAAAEGGEGEASLGPSPSSRLFLVCLRIWISGQSHYAGWEIQGGMVWA